jgi:inhibitor of cysteine peptidase
VVENIEVRILETYPVQIHVELSGYLPDGCTTIRATEVENAGTTFRIRMTTGRPANAMCTMAITPFQEVVPLDVIGLPAGVYQVAVNDLWAEFTLP